MLYKSLGRHVTEFLPSFVALTPMEEQRRNTKLKIGDFVTHKIPIHRTTFLHSFFKYGLTLIIILTKWWTIKVNHPSLDIWIYVIWEAFLLYTLLLIFK